MATGLFFHRIAASVRLQSAVQHFHERGFSSAIFTEECVDFTFAYGKRHPVACAQRAKYFGHAFHLKKRAIL